MLAILMNSMRLRRKHKLKMEKKKDVMVCCRTCLTTEDLHPIFCGKGSKEKRTEELRLVTGLEIKNNDGLPQKICSKCLDYMNDALKFRWTSEKANETLFSMGYRKLNALKAKTTTSLSKSCDKIAEIAANSSVTYHNDDTDFAFDNNCEDLLHSNDLDYGNNKIYKSRKTKKEPIQYKCNLCNKEFRMKNTYRAHMRFHTNFCVCELCGKKCRNNNLLLLHKRGRHGMDRIHKCTYCEYSSANKEGLIIHERRHTGEKPYICDHCGASFHRRSNLVQHIAIHLPEKNFQCDQCHKKFHSKKFLQSHKFKMHQQRRYNYACDICRAHFTSTDSARKHLARTHGIARDAQGPVTRIPNRHPPHS